MEELDLHITSCLHPQRIRNRFTNEMVTVPCGKCEACCQNHANRMIQRLNMERLSWKYCVFVTLTFDNDHLPILKVADKNLLIDSDPKRVHPIKGVKIVPVLESLEKIHRKNDHDLGITYAYSELCTAKFGGIPYLSSVVAQRFIKRLRINLIRQYAKQTIFQEKTVPSFRYFLCGEYGPTTYRPHYHLLLFFNSEYFAAHVQEFVRVAWKFGYTDSSFVTECNSSYVAGYVNSTANLPAILQVLEIRPFSLFSKHPALGTLAFSEETLKSQFLSCDVTQCLLSTTAKLPCSVPLWRTFENSLYPKLPYYDRFDDRTRKLLYLVCSLKKFQYSDQTFQCFVNIVNGSKLEYIQKYIDVMNDTDGNLLDKYYRWFSVSLRVLKQSDIFDITPSKYVDTIFRFFNTKEYEILKSQYVFQENYSKNHDILQMIGLDGAFFDTLSSTILAGFDFSDLDAVEQSYLMQFDNLDLDKLFSVDIDTRRTYLYTLEFECSDEYRFYSSQKRIIYDKSTKTKRKNDYLLAQTDDFYNQISCF